MIASFILCLSLFIVIGLLSALKNTHTSVDYLLAGHNVSPWLVALSAIATNNSGYMFIGMIGYTYVVGLSSIWLMIGWIVGDWIASLYIHKPLRIVTEKQSMLSFAGALSAWHGTYYPVLRAMGGAITLVFLGIYAAAQLNAGSKALHVLFGWDYWVGSTIGAVIVLLYCVAGGIRASIWTDVAQSFVMILAMTLLCIMSILKIGGIHAFIKAMAAVSPSYMAIFPHHFGSNDVLSPGLFVLGWIFAGFGVVGQPHIMVRFMAMDRAEHIGRVRFYYYAWYLLFYTLTICVGFAARLLLPSTSQFDAELALPTLAQQLLPAPLVGVILAGLFAATMSTADSQILSCTAALTRDLMNKTAYFITKLATALITLFALLIALFAHESVFNLVLIAWSALASAFAPLMIVYVCGGKPSQKLALVMMFVGISCMLMWRYLDLNQLIYEVAPGMCAGIMTYFVGRCCCYK